MKHESYLIAALIAVSTASMIEAKAHEYIPIEPSNCQPSVEDWIQHEARGGEKFVNGFEWRGAYGHGLIRWDSGTVQDITVGPALDPRGHPAICLIARRHVSSGDAS